MPELVVWGSTAADYRSGQPCRSGQPFVDRHAPDRHAAG